MVIDQGVMIIRWAPYFCTKVDPDQIFWSPSSIPRWPSCGPYNEECMESSLRTMQMGSGLYIHTYVCNGKCSCTLLWWELSAGPLYDPTKPFTHMLNQPTSWWSPKPGVCTHQMVRLHSRCSKILRYIHACIHIGSPSSARLNVGPTCWPTSGWDVGGFEDLHGPLQCTKNQPHLTIPMLSSRAHKYISFGWDVQLIQ